MLINKHTAIYGPNVVLIPYKKEHVLKYHSWMQLEELQKLTASKPLSLEEEYDMQKSWMLDENKCTFVILDREIFEKTGNEIDAMIGDTNLFFATPDDRICAEAEIMIAEDWARGKKLGKQSIFLMLLYGITYIGVKQFVVKIGDDNEVSINLFKKLGFIEESRSLVFEEVTLSKIVDEDWKIFIVNSVKPFEVNENYGNNLL